MNSKIKSILVVLYLIVLIVTTGRLEAEDNPFSQNFSLSLSYKSMLFDMKQADMKFNGPEFRITHKIGNPVSPSFKVGVSFFKAKDSIEVGNSSLEMKFKNVEGFATYIYQKYHLELGLAYRWLTLKSCWENIVDEDNWDGLGIVVNKYGNFSDSFSYQLSINYFPSLTSTSSTDYSILRYRISIAYKISEKNYAQAFYEDEIFDPKDDSLSDINNYGFGIGITLTF